MPMPSDLDEHVGRRRGGTGDGSADRRRMPRQPLEPT
jgi:hypothetical protein